MPLAEFGVCEKSLVISLQHKTPDKVLLILCSSF